MEDWPASRSSLAILAREGWSGRRGSNPRPTAWKAVTLPLSYSRLRVSRALFRRALTVSPPRGALSLARRLGRPAVGRSRPRERKMVAREGLEPSKPLGRQIYSLLRLTASLPRQLAVYLEILVVSVYLRLAKPSTELAKGFEPPTC